MAASGPPGAGDADGSTTGPPAGGAPAWAAPGAPSEAATPPPPRTAPPTASSRDERRGAVALPAPLRPLTIGDVIDGAFQVLKRAPAVVLGLSALAVIPVQLLAAWLQRDAVTDLEAVFGDTSTLQSSSTVEGGELVTSFVVLGLSALAPAFVGAGIAVLVAGWYAGRSPDLGDVLRSLAGVAPALIGAFLLGHVVIGIGLVACVVPGAIAMVLFVVAMPVVAVERTGPLAALQRSVSLVSRRFWRAAGVVALSIAGSLVLDTSLTFVPSVLALVVPEAWAWVVLGVGASLAALIVTPVVAAATVLLYVDLRFRAEGLDLELRATDALGPSPR